MARGDPASALTAQSFSLHLTSRTNSAQEFQAGAWGLEKRAACINFRVNTYNFFFNREMGSLLPRGYPQRGC